MRSTVSTCFAANNILLMRSWNHVLERKMADRFPLGSPLTNHDILLNLVQ